MDKYDARLGAAITAVIFFLLSGMVLFHWLEGWSYFESFYFTGMTVTTVGYGDFVPVTFWGRLLTIIYAFGGIGVVFFSVGIIAQKYFERQQERLNKVWKNTTSPMRALHGAAGKAMGKAAGRVADSVAERVTGKKKEPDRYVELKIKE